MPRCFKPRTVRLLKPVESTGELISHVNVPCGKCVNCIKRRRMEWCFRMEQELVNSKVAYFVTLTYDEENVPWDKYGNRVLLDSSLRAKKIFRKAKGLPDIADKYLRKMKMKEHGFVDKSIQSFFKRLRINSERYKDAVPEMWWRGLDLKKDKIKYFVCGEYGGDPRFTMRPHYHAIIFNASKKLIKDSWSFGDVDISLASKSSIAYCTKYMDKWKDKKQDWKRPVEFNNQSEGLGMCFVDKMRDWYKKNLDINFVVNDAGVRIPMPRIYRLKLFNEDELSTQVGIIHRAVLKEKEDFIMRYGEEAYLMHERELEAAKTHRFVKMQKKRDQFM